MEKTTLVIILSETRAHELTFDNFKTNVLNRLNADLCICIGVKDDYNYENPFYQTALYKFTYPEPDDYADAFNYAYETIIKENVETNGTIHWRQYLKIKDQFLGGIKDPVDEHPGSAGILIFFRWFLMKNLIDNDLLNKYDRFIITRSDFVYQLPHPQLNYMNENNIWIPDADHCGGYTDRHVILSKNNIIPYLNILPNFILKPKDYFEKMISSKHNTWNLEQLIRYHLNANKVINTVREFPYIMYSVRPINGSTRWSKGIYNEALGYYIKYVNEYNHSSKYKSQFLNSKLDTDSFYFRIIHKIPMPNLNHQRMKMANIFTMSR